MKESSGKFPQSWEVLPHSPPSPPALTSPEGFSLLGVLCSFKIWSIIALQCCESAMCIHTSPPSWTSLPRHHPTHLGHHRERAELPVLYSRFPLASYFTHGSVYMSILISQFIPPFPSPTVSTSPFSTSASVFLPCK